MTFRCDGTLDIECAHWTKFAVATTHDLKGTKVHRTKESLVDHLLRQTGCHWAHCGGKYDFLLIAEEFRRRGIKCQIDPAGSRIARMTVGRRPLNPLIEDSPIIGQLELRDSYLLMPLKHSVLCDLVGLEKPAMGLPCMCGTGCDGVCSVRPNDTRRVVWERCAFDSESLYRIIWAMHDAMAEHGIHLRGTIGTTAWFNAKLRMELPDACFPPPVWRALHAAYFGGRTGVYRPRARGPGTHWDMSAAYPSALSRAVLPLGGWREIGSRDALRALGKGAPGIYSATVTMGDRLLQPLPIRVSSGRIAYPSGTFSGSWALPELEQAIERDAQIDRVHSAIVWDSSGCLFAPLMNEWVSLRAKFGKYTVLGKMMRELCNHLTGKFAEGPDRKSIQMFPDPKRIRICHGRRPCSIRKCVGACMAWEQIDMDGAIWGVPYLRYAKSGHVHWAAYLTAQTRATWLDAAEIDPEKLVYGATDSIWTLSDKAPGEIGPEVGQWERKGRWSEFECVGPGAYRYKDEFDGVWIKTSGISLSDEEWLSGSANRFDVAPLLSAARSGGSLFQRIPRQWSLNRRRAQNGQYGDRILDPRSGMTYPMRYEPKIGEYESLQSP